MNKTAKKYFINTLLIVFSWFFLIEPWFAFSAKQSTDKFEYNDASKEASSFDSSTYFQISKDDSDTDEVDSEKQALAFLNPFVILISFLNENTFIITQFFTSYLPPVSSVKLCILNKIIRI